MARKDRRHRAGAELLTELLLNRSLREARVQARARGKTWSDAGTNGSINFQAIILEVEEAFDRARSLVITPGLEAFFAGNIQEVTNKAARPARAPMLISGDPTGDELLIQARASLIERSALELCVFAATAMGFGNTAHIKAIAIALERLATPQSETALERYPALLLLYTAAAAAILSKNGEGLRELILETEFESKQGTQDIVTCFHVDDVTRELTHILPINARANTNHDLPWHNHLRAWAQPILYVTAASDRLTSERAMNIFEFLRMLLQFDLEIMPVLHPGCFVYTDQGNLDVQSFLHEIKADGPNTWIKPLFGHSTERFARALRAFDQANENNTLSRGASLKTTLPLGLAELFAS